MISEVLNSKKTERDISIVDREFKEAYMNYVNGVLGKNKLRRHSRNVVERVFA